ncbi:MAG: MBL fold metallo-hydrolase [Gemmatimonas sp.]|nr:MBL fold metallo-hydrolase [Gemmatimonas sp.]
MSMTHPLPDPPPPREIAPNVFWLGGCLQDTLRGVAIHNHVAPFLIIGDDASVLVDTGFPSHWQAVSEQLDSLLDGRQLNWLIPTHSELPHAGNLGRLLEKFEEARLVGDLADYHLYYPESTDRFVAWPKERPLKLGGGYEVLLLPAPIRDLSRTQWLYEASQKVLFVGDGFAYTHAPADGPLGEPGHSPGQCRLLSSELPKRPTPADAVLVTQNALAWAQLVDAEAIRDEVRRLMERYEPKLVAPGHGNVIDEPHDLEQVIFDAFRIVFEEYAGAT